MNRETRTRVPPESETVEWKQSLGEWREIVETCAAFATSRGGTIYVGMSPGGEPVGVQIGAGTIEDLANKIKINTDPSQYPAIDISHHKEKALIEVRTESNPVKPVWAFGRPVKRVGKTNQFLRRDEVQRLVENTAGRSWDAFTCQAFTSRDVDKTAVRDYLARVGMSLATPFDDVLRNIKVPFGPNGYCNAAVLLFGKSPQSFVVESQLKCGRFKGVESVDFEDEQTYEGPILRQLEDAMGFVGRHTRRAYRITGRPEREVIPEYPEDAIREALINALCHRNYATVGTIQVRIYDNRIEVWNPGHLPSDLTLRELYQRHASHPGNPLIAQALYRARLIEHWGTGTLRIIRACRKANIKVGFETAMGTFIVTLTKQATRTASESGAVRRKAQEAQVEAQEAQVAVTAVEMGLLAGCQRGPKSAKELLAAAGYTSRTGNFKRSLAKLIENRLLELTLPDKPNSRLQKYQLTSRGKSLLQRGKG
jgi:ATP-dependent DNA helicase RecG